MQEDTQGQGAKHSLALRCNAACHSTAALAAPHHPAGRCFNGSTLAVFWTLLRSTKHSSLFRVYSISLRIGYNYTSALVQLRAKEVSPPSAVPTSLSVTEERSRSKPSLQGCLTTYSEEFMPGSNRPEVHN